MIKSYHQKQLQVETLSQKKKKKKNLTFAHRILQGYLLCCVPQYENPGTLRTRIYTFHMFLINLTNAVNKRT